MLDDFIDLNLASHVARPLAWQQVKVRSNFCGIEAERSVELRSHSFCDGNNSVSCEPSLDLRYWLAKAERCARNKLDQYCTALGTFKLIGELSSTHLFA
jgi:hypothetical protein